MPFVRAHYRRPKSAAPGCLFALAMPFLVVAALVRWISDNIGLVSAVLGTTGLVVIVIAFLRERRERNVARLLDLARQAADDPRVDLSPLRALRGALGALSTDASEELLSHYTGAATQALADRALELHESQRLAELASAFGLGPAQLARAHRDAFLDALEAAIADGRVTSDEDEWVRRLREQLDVSPTLVATELQLVGKLREATRAAEQPLVEVATDVRLQAGEVAYFSGRAQEVKRVVARSSQRNGVRTNEYAYEPVDTGTLVVTNRRLLFVGAGSRAFKHEKVQNIEAQVRDARLLVSVDGRATPLVYSLDSAAIAGVLLSRATKLTEQAR